MSKIESSFSIAGDMGKPMSIKIDFGDIDGMKFE